MDLNLLIDFFKGRGTIDLVRYNFKDEVSEFSYTSKHKDSSRLYVTNENDYDLLDSELIMLLTQYLDDRLTEIELEYILAVLDLLEKWDYSDEAREVIFDFCDPAIGYDITKPNIAEDIKFLKGEVLNLDSCKTARHRK